MIRGITIILFTLFCCIGYAQNPGDTIVKKLEKYYHADRENIYVHTDKQVFFTNETVWLKGYVFHQKNNTPFFMTTNVFASMIDAKGKVIDTQLLYCNLGTFSGYFDLNKKIASGTYYLQFYTNWMNNFSEDESYVKKIVIINEDENPANILGRKNKADVKISIAAESGVYLRDVPNTFGLSLSQCDGSPAIVKTADIFVKGKKFTTVQFNRDGNGKLTLPAGTYPDKAVVTVNDDKYEQEFPLPAATGITLNVSNFSIQGQTIVTLTTNTTSLPAYTGKPLLLLAHKEDKVMIFSVNMNNQTEQKIVIPSEKLFDGMNIIRLIDQNYKELASRLVYNHHTERISKVENISVDAFAIYTGKINSPLMETSISVLPQESMAIGNTDDIYYALLIAPYIKGHKKAEGRYYFNEFSKARQYELDLLLLNSEIKYSWSNIMHNPPKIGFTFDKGLTLKGKAPQSANRKSQKVRMLTSAPFIDEYTKIDDDYSFEFDRLMLNDSTVVKFSLNRVNEKNATGFTAVPVVENHARKYYKPYMPLPECYRADIEFDDVIEIAAPKINEGTIELETVEIKGKRLRYAESFGNRNLQAYKISDMNIGGYQTVITFLRNHSGFDVIDINNEEVKILGRSRTTINGGANGPAVYLDNVQLMSFDILRSIELEDVDEIYMNAHAIVPSVRNFIGIIKIYMKKGMDYRRKKSAAPEIVIKKGFQRGRRFRNTEYASLNDIGFKKFGLVTWEPYILTDEGGNFKFRPNNNVPNTVKVLIEGFSANGKLISEIRTVSIP